MRDAVEESSWLNGLEATYQALSLGLFCWASSVLDLLFYVSGPGFLDFFQLPLFISLGILGM